MTQLCTECGNRSVRGLKSGHGKCQWHWDAGVWGREWSQKINGPEPIAQRGIAEVLRDTLPIDN